MPSSRLAIVVDEYSDWAPFHATDDLVLARDYLRSPAGPRRRVINLCADLRYRSVGYYVSLLAEARGDRVSPRSRALADLAAEQLPALPRRYGLAVDGDGIEDDLFFGESSVPALAQLGKRLFAELDLPMMRVRLSREASGWRVISVVPLSLEQLDGDAQDRFATAIDRFSRRIWRKAPAGKRFRHELAILVNPGERLPPSNRGALERFRRVGRELGLDVDLIGPEDEARIPEFDALFLRETTAINHHSWRFARRTEREGLVVIDDPQSIERCANKVFLHELLAANRVPVPDTALIFAGSLEAQIDALTLSLPLVLKIPDGSFSRGMALVEDTGTLVPKARELLGEASVLLAQEYLRTEFDWRIGIIGRRVLFACKYFMSRGHWQIYEHQADGASRSGGFEPVAVSRVPREVLRAALRAAKLIGDGLYGVDLKVLPDGRVVVMEVNDNPNIDHQVEDAFLGDELYRTILGTFLERLEAR